MMILSVTLKNIEGTLILLQARKPFIPCVFEMTCKSPQ